jgi:hypothetical protein
VSLSLDSGELNNLRHYLKENRMANLEFADAFAKFGAKLRNVQWSVCAIAPDGSLVVSLWQHHFGKAKSGKIHYRDSSSRWSGPGNTEFRKNVTNAFLTQQLLKAVIVHTDEVDVIESGADASKVKKSFSIKEDWRGRVQSIEGENYIFEFERG